MGFEKAVQGFGIWGGVGPTLHLHSIRGLQQGHLVRFYWGCTGSDEVGCFLWMMANVYGCS